MNSTTHTELRSLMDFDHVVRVLDGVATDDNVPHHAPETIVDVDADGQILAEHEADLLADVKAAGWTLLDGYSGQYLYSGPIMHPSEYIGGRLADDILAEDGFYVSVVVRTTDDDEDAGWAIAYRPLDT